MNVRTFKKRYWITVICLVVFYYLLNFGVLFAWNPWKPGYETFSAEKYSVSFQDGTELPEFYKSLDSYLGSTGDRLELPLIHDIKVIRTDKAGLKSYLPWMKTESLGGAALQTGDVLYISSEKIAEMGLNEEEYVKHEVVHLMQHQHANLLNSFNAMKVTYLSEGVPFAMGGPKFYDRDEFLSLVKKAKLTETTEGHAIYTPESFEALDETSAERYKVSHMLYGEFVKYLIGQYGQEKFNAFNKEFLKNPSLHRTLFEEQYGKKLEVVLQEFETALK